MFLVMRAQSRASGVIWLREIVAQPCLSCRSFGERRSSCHTAAARSVGRVRRGDHRGRVWSSDAFMHGNGARMQEHAALAPDFLPDTQWKCPRSGGVVTPEKLSARLARILSKVESLDTGQGRAGHSSLPTCRGRLKLDDSCFNPCMVAAEPRGTTRDWALNCSSQMDLTSCEPGVTGESPHSRRIM